MTTDNEIETCDCGLCGGEFAEGDLDDDTGYCRECLKAEGAVELAEERLLDADDELNQAIGDLDADLGDADWREAIYKVNQLRLAKVKARDALAAAEAA